MKNPFDDFVSADSTPLYADAAGKTTVCHLLWGDGVRIVGTKGARTQVKARGARGWVKSEHLGGKSLLEVYFIDVGQGDGLLIKTPDFRHIMLDGGNPRRLNDTRKSAADFVDWKFFKDYGSKQIHLDAMIASHCDIDHYGGLSDLLDVKQIEELDAQDVRVDRFYHAGLSWWEKGDSRELGSSARLDGREYWTQLLEGNASVEQAIGDGKGPKLSGPWRELFERVVACKARDGSMTEIARLSHSDAFMPSFGPQDEGGVAVKVLGPVEFEIGGKPALRKFPKSESQNTNGVSILLRIDYGSTRILLTGDLNAASQQTLLEDYTGQVLEFQCDVAKACHHGSEDVSYAFLQAMRPSITVISSGDCEGYDHPRPSIVAASALTGHVEIREDRVVTPLIYSTELSRSVDLVRASRVAIRSSDDVASPIQLDLKQSQLGRVDIEAAKKKMRLRDTMVVGGLVYGLVNVRTDGHRILSATRDEGSSNWRIETTTSRF